MTRSLIDTHSTPIAGIYPDEDQVVDQAHAFVDKRSDSSDIAIQNSGYEITRTTNSTGLSFTTCKVGKADTVTEYKKGSKRIISISSGAGATIPLGGICKTESVPTAPPAFTSAANTTCTIGKACDFLIAMEGRPEPKLTVAGGLPRGLMLISGSDDAAEITGTPAKGTAGGHELTFTTVNNGDEKAVQEFTLTIKSKAS